MFSEGTDDLAERLLTTLPHNCYPAALERLRNR